MKGAHKLLPKSGSDSRNLDESGLASQSDRVYSGLKDLQDRKQNVKWDAVHGGI